jgi:ABC-type lipoprotein export system ATPase subunit
MNSADSRSNTDTAFSLTILGGVDKRGRPERLHLTLRPGDVLSIVGPTGAGKSRFLEDIECLACGDTPTARQILVNGAAPDAGLRGRAKGKLVAQLSQNMNFVMDLTVREFVDMHAESRCLPPGETLTTEIVACANLLTGEKISAAMPLTQLSGGQSRALMIADTALLSPSPIVLIDELENAGVDRRKALDLLVRKDKIVLISTHDPVLALLGRRRVCIREGAVRALLETSDAERENAAFLSRIDEKMLALRDMLRQGQQLDFEVDDYFAESGPRSSMPLSPTDGLDFEVDDYFTEEKYYEKAASY